MLFVCVIAINPYRFAISQETHGIQNRASIDKMRDRDLQPEKIMDAVKVHQGMNDGEAGAGYGYFTFKLSKRIGSTGIVFANDIASESLQQIEMKCRSANITNIRTVLGTLDDPLFPNNDLDMVIVFDCLFEFSQPVEWMRNTKKYLKNYTKNTSLTEMKNS
jgi:ubiquinone/menaquinone biosynthesis C-methylase UbiE